MSKYENMALVAGWNKSVLSACNEVKDIDEEIREFMPYLIRTMRREDGMAISANQVGINKRVFVTNVPEDYIKIYVNPVLLGTGGATLDTREGCLSFPGKQIVTQRKRHAVIRALNLKGEQFIIDTRDELFREKTSILLSVCFQHEMDHMNGVDMRAYG